MESSETLQKEAAGYYNLITWREIEENLYATLQDVFVSWLEQRFSEKSKQEIDMLLLGASPEIREHVAELESADVDKLLMQLVSAESIDQMRW